MVDAGEGFVAVPGLDGRIFVNLDGCVKHCKKDGISGASKNVPNVHGYVQVSLRDRDGTRRKVAVHRLVWITFVGPIPNGKTIDHFDRNRSNNELSNLRLATPAQQRANQKVHKPRRDAREIFVWRLTEPQNVMRFGHSRKAAAVLGANQRALRSVANGKAKRTGEFCARWVSDDGFYDGEVFRTVTISGADVTISNFGRYLDGKSKAFAVAPKAAAGNHYPTVGTMSVLMHKAVATAWSELVEGKPGPGKTIDHKDRNRENNHPGNLRWATAVEQAANR